MARQMGAIATTLTVSMLSGYATGKVMALFQEDDITDGANLFVDKSYWETTYFDPSVPRYPSPHSKHSIKAFSKHSQKYDLTANNHSAVATVAAAPEHAPGDNNDPSENA